MGAGAQGGWQKFLFCDSPRRSRPRRILYSTSMAAGLWAADAGAGGPCRLILGLREDSTSIDQVANALGEVGRDAVERDRRLDVG